LIILDTVQFTYPDALIKGKAKSILVLLKSLILIACAWFIFTRLSEIVTQFQQFVGIFYNNGFLFWLSLGVVPVLMPLNWFLEAIKWRLLTRHIQAISIKESYNSVLAGIAFGFATPQSMGDYFGRMLAFSHKNKALIVVPLALGRAAQMLPTLLFGAIGVWVISNQVHMQTSLYVVPVLLLVASLIFLVGYNKIEQFVSSLIARFGPIAQKLKAISGVDIARIIGFSFLRYLVFGSQFLIVMMVFEVEASLFIIVSGITWIFFAKSVIPSFSFLSDLGIREFSAVLFFEAFNIPLAPVLAASLFIWFINIALPAMAGLVSVQRTKF